MKVLKICLVLLPLFLVIGFLTDILLFMIIYIMILLTFFGIWGGKWLWEVLASSDVFKSGVPIYVKIIGCLGLLALFSFIIVGFFIFYQGEERLIQEIVQQGTILMFYASCYNIGYLISIWKPIDTQLDGKSSKFKVKKRLSFFVLVVILIYVLISYFLAFLYTGELFSLLFVYLALGGVGFALGWLFWEHLKETKMLSGKFLKDLKVLSVIFEIPIVIVTILGMISGYFQSIILLRFILLCYLLLFYLLAAYFIGLMSEIIKK